MDIAAGQWHHSVMHFLPPLLCLLLVPVVDVHALVPHISHVLKSVPVTSILNGFHIGVTGGDYTLGKRPRV